MNQETLALPGARLHDRAPPSIDIAKLYRYRLNRLRLTMQQADVGLCLLSNPLSLRYAADIRQYAAFQARVPVLYLAVPLEGPVIAYGGFRQPDTEPPSVIEEARDARALNVFEAGLDCTDQLALFRKDMQDLVPELQLDNRRIALENLNPIVPVALAHDGFEILDAQVLLEQARLIKSAEEIECMKWSIAVAEHGIAMMRESLQPGISENELWALLHYVNIANDGESFDSRQLTSGPRTNPFGEEASDRIIESGDLVAFDTDMIGPYGYCADISRTFLCGPSAPTAAQRDLYSRAYDQLQHNLALIEVGTTYAEIANKAYRYDTGYHQCNFVLHGIGMSDENPYINTDFAQGMRGEDVVRPGMVLCVEAYAGKVGGVEGVKLEEQVLVTGNGVEVLTRFPFEEQFLSG